MKAIYKILVLSGLSLFVAANSFAGGMVYSRTAVNAGGTSGSGFELMGVRSAGKVAYYGGPVISNVKVFTVFWGDKVNPEIVQKFPDFYKTLANSSYMDWMKEYNTNVTSAEGKPGTNQTIGRGTYGGTFTITPNNAAISLDKKDVEAELVKQVEQGKLPAPDANTLYMIHYPPGVTLLTGGEASCQTWCADHEGFQNAKYGNFYYAMMPDVSACMFGCGFAGTVFDSISVAASHELAESVTDPLCPDIGQTPGYPAAWIDGQEEIGDKCTGQPVALSAPNPYQVQEEWSNNLNQCFRGPFGSP